MPEVTEQVDSGAGMRAWEHLQSTCTDILHQLLPVGVAQAFWGEASEAFGLPPPMTDSQENTAAS